MQSSSIFSRVVLSRPACRVVRAAVEVQSVSLGRRPQVAMRSVRAVSGVASVAVGCRRSAVVAGFGWRWVSGAQAISLALPASPNPAFEPTAASGVGSIPR
jgi:hypothetical protein